MIRYAVLVSELGARARATRTVGCSPDNEESALPVSLHQIPRNADYVVLIHDLRLTSRIKNSSVWYPYHEWYDGRRLKVFKEPQFGKDNVLKFLDDKWLGKYKMLLWHMGWIKSNTTEI